MLMARGMTPVDDHEEADIILYNTCSIREKAAQKVFSRLGAFRKGNGGAGKMIGVLGCVAQQEGERFFERAPQVSLVCGSASYSQAAGVAGPARIRKPAGDGSFARHRGLL